jgi:hypothetical protein
MEVSGQLHVPAALLAEKEAPVPLSMEVGWAAEPVWTLWSREISHAPAENRTPAVYTDVAVPVRDIEQCPNCFTVLY